jgi:hypothetical protein
MAHLPEYSNAHCIAFAPVIIGAVNNSIRNDVLGAS